MQLHLVNFIHQEMHGMKGNPQICLCTHNSYYLMNREDLQFYWCLIDSGNCDIYLSLHWSYTCVYVIHGISESYI